MIGELRKLNKSAFALRLLYRIEDRIDERRLKVASTLLAYLEFPNFLDQDDLHLSYAGKFEMAKLARDIYLRLFHVPKPSEETGTTENDEQEPVENPDEPVAPTPPKRSRSNEQRERLANRRAKYQAQEDTFSRHTSATLLTSIKNEMKDYEVMKKRPEKLDQVPLERNKNRKISTFSFVWINE